MKRFLAIAAGLACTAAPALAHDLWIEPSHLRADAGESVTLSLRLGDGGAGDPLTRDARRFVRFAVVGPAGERPAEGAAGRDPAAAFVADSRGAWTVVYASTRATQFLEAADFEASARRAGLDGVVAARRAAGQGDRAGREIVTRIAKAIVVVGGDAAGFDREMGLALEIVPEKNPLALAGALPVCVLRDGRPLEGAMIVATSRADARRTTSGHTDAEGRVRLALDGEGAWLLSTAVASPAAAGSKADWEIVASTLLLEAARGSR
jgi:uncharacterized GH25 family protein